MVSRKPFYLLVALLYIVGLGMTFYHHIALDVPLTPGEKRQIWSIEAKLEFEATGEPVIASLAIPGTQPGFTLMNENAASPGYGLSFVEKDGDARAEWSIRAASGRQELYYRVCPLYTSDAADDPFRLSDAGLPLINKHTRSFKTDISILHVTFVEFNSLSRTSLLAHPTIVVISVYQTVL
ncbi:UUP1 family membrane protein, partial [Aeromonas caviae]|uniref:UUP1 family membrane protein n=1 Tax=Aeromonas caviae TaxID=648 RepID=UPI0025B71B2E